MHTIDTALVDWSRAQFTLTAMYHWLFVPLTLGLGLIMSIMESVYYKTGNVFWKNTAKFWMKLFGINFVIGVATGLILEFEFGTNWSNYSWFVGDIFGAPLAIEAIIAFFLEATFITVMFFGWNKVSKKAHLTATWLTWIGASLSALFILVANAWMQYPTGMYFNPENVRGEMINFGEILFSPVAINKFLHTFLSGWMVGGAFAVGIGSWYLLKKREEKFALKSMQVGAIVGLAAAILLAVTGDQSGYQVAQKQPMKLAAMEGLYEGEKEAGLVAIGILNPKKQSYNDSIDPFLFNIRIPYLLSFLATRDYKSFVPGIKDLMEGGYENSDGETEISATEKIERGKIALQALADYKQATANKTGTEADAEKYKQIVEDNFKYFGHGYMDSPEQLIPPIAITFYSFRIMVIFGVFFIGLFMVVLFYLYKKKMDKLRWLHWICLLSIPLAYITS